jgi:hypothetical protein
MHQLQSRHTILCLTPCSRIYTALANAVHAMASLYTVAKFVLRTVLSALCTNTMSMYMSAYMHCYINEFSYVRMSLYAVCTSPSV